MKFVRILGFGAVSLGVTAVAAPAAAFPGFFVGKKDTVGVEHATHMAIMIKDDTSIVSVMPDYEGPLEPFAVVMPVPSDVTADHIKTLKADFLDRLEQMTAPRFMEFWEMDPCDPGPLEQEWERSKLANPETNFLGGGAISTPEKKVPKEMLLTVTPEFKEGEYTMSVLPKDKAGDLAGFLKGKGYVLPDKAAQAIKPYVDSGMSVLVAEVDSKKIELVGGERAQLSPIRFWTKSEYTKIPVRLGLLDAEKRQELFVYVLSADKRYEVKNYPNVFPPTNVSVDFVVKERMGEFYNALDDIIQKHDPKAFLDEYAWPSEGCGQPCPNEALLPNELLSLGGDVLEEAVPEEEKNPEPPPLTEEEEKKQKEELKELKPAERIKAKKDAEADRKELARRKALLARQKYVLSRLHYVYDGSNLPEDPVIGPAGPVAGGAGIPKGQKMEISTEVKPAPKNQLQVRYNFFHPWGGMMKCENPERWRWGKPPRTYRGLRKTWVAVDLTRKDRKQIDPLKVVQTPIPALGISGMSEEKADAGGADAGAAKPSAPAKKKGCGCSIPGAPEPATGAWLGVALACSLASRRRRRR